VPENHQDWPESPDAQAALWSREHRLSERWPFGPPAFHESACLLFERAGYCDCKASDCDDTEWGWGA